MSFTLFWYFETDGKAHLKHYANPPTAPPAPTHTHTDYLKGKHLCTLVENWTGWIVSVKRHFYLKGQAVIIEIWLFCIWKIISCRLMQWACHFQNKWQYFYHWVFRWKVQFGKICICYSELDSFPECKWFLMRSMSINECVLRYHTMKCVNIWKIVWLSEQYFPRDQCKMLQNHS